MLRREICKIKLEVLKTNEFSVPAAKKKKKKNAMYYLCCVTRRMDCVWQ